MTCFRKSSDQVGQRRNFKQMELAWKRWLLLCTSPGILSDICEEMLAVRVSSGWAFSYSCSWWILQLCLKCSRLFTSVSIDVQSEIPVYERTNLGYPVLVGCCGRDANRTYGLRLFLTFWRCNILKTIWLGLFSSLSASWFPLWEAWCALRFIWCPSSHFPSRQQKSIKYCRSQWTSESRNSRLLWYSCHSLLTGQPLDVLTYT